MSQSTHAESSSRGSTAVAQGDYAPSGPAFYLPQQHGGGGAVQVMWQHGPGAAPSSQGGAPGGGTFAGGYVLLPHGAQPGHAPPAGAFFDPQQAAFHAGQGGPAMFMPFPSHLSQPTSGGGGGTGAPGGGYEHLHQFANDHGGANLAPDRSTSTGGGPARDSSQQHFTSKTSGTAGGATSTPSQQNPPAQPMLLYSPQHLLPPSQSHTAGGVAPTWAFAPTAAPGATHQFLPHAQAPQQQQFLHSMNAPPTQPHQSGGAVQSPQGPFLPAQQPAQLFWTTTAGGQLPYGAALAPQSVYQQLPTTMISQYQHVQGQPAARSANSAFLPQDRRGSAGVSTGAMLSGNPRMQQHNASRPQGAGAFATGPARSSAGSAQQSFKSTTGQGAPSTAAVPRGPREFASPCTCDRCEPPSSGSQDGQGSAALQSQAPSAIIDEGRQFVDELRRDRIDRNVSFRVAAMTIHQLNCLRSALEADVNLVYNLCENERGRIICSVLDRCGGDNCPGIMRVVTSRFMELAVSQRGCIALPRVAEAVDGTAFAETLFTICETNAAQLACNRYGNYVCNHYVGTDRQEFIARFCAALGRQHDFTTRIAVDKYGSYVVDELLKRGSFESMKPLLDRIFIHDEVELRTLSADPCGNYIVQAAFDAIHRCGADPTPYAAATWRVLIFSPFAINIAKHINGGNNNNAASGSTSGGMMGSGGAPIQLQQQQPAATGGMQRGSPS